MLFCVMVIIFVFAHPLIRKKAYKFFWMTHSLYVVLYLLCLVHGLARITGPPRFWLFFIGPGIIYTLDKVSYYNTVNILFMAHLGLAEHAVLRDNLLHDQCWQKSVEVKIKQKWK